MSDRGFRWIRFAPLFFLFVLVACSGSSDEDVAVDSDEIGGNPSSLNIGFGGAATAPAGDPFQFDAIAEFFSKTKVQPGPRLCHRYLSWDIGLLAPGSGDVKDSTSRANFEAWLADGANPCTNVLVSFKAAGDTANRAPTDFHDTPGCTTCFGTAFKAFLDSFSASWRASAPNRAFSFTAWNEPNNGAGPGDGLPDRLSAVNAAQYYLMARHLCGVDASHCDVAAGDLASNGSMIDDFQQNCSSDVSPTLCANASWLDAYKHFIYAHANDPAFRLGADFRPEFWAYHPWQEINDYVYRGETCTKASRCSTIALLHSLQGSWASGKIWDTEIGAGQNSENQPNDGVLDDRTQAKGAAYILYVSSHFSNRIWRIYYQGVETGAWQIECGGRDRPSFGVLAKRETSYSGGDPKICNSL